MGLINQPSSQIKLTNVSLVRLKKGKKRFEIACYQNKVQDWRNKVEKDLDEVLQIPQVFLNVSKGQVASHSDLQKGFGKINVDEIILEILDKGEIQLNEKERNSNLEQKNNEFLNIISAKCINPTSRKRYPPSMIQKVLTELKFHLNPSKPAKIQALEAIKLLVSKQIIPIARAQMKVKITLSNKAKNQVWSNISELIDTVEDDFQDSKTFECTAILDPYNYKSIMEILQGESSKVRKGEGIIEVLDLAVAKDANQNYRQI